MDKFTARFTDSLKSSSLRGAKQILAELPGEPDGVCCDVLDTLALVPEDTAWELLMFLSEISFGTPDIRGRLFHLIQNRARLNFQFLPILYRAGTREKIRESAPLMKQVLSSEIDTGILVETIRTAGEYRITSLVDAISEYIYFDNDELKAHAVQALERMATPRALELLEDAAATVKCDQRILDAVSVLKQSQDPEQANATPLSDPDGAGQSRFLLETNATLENRPCKPGDSYRALESKDLETRFKAFTELSVSDNISVHRLKQNLLSASHDLVINTIGIIKTTLPPAMAAPLYSLLAVQPLPGTIKFAAYDALASFPDLVEPAPATLTDMHAPERHLCMAAINLLDKTPTDHVLSLIKNQIETGRKKGEVLAQTILDVKAKNLIASLMVSDTFVYVASNYLLKQAAISPLQEYIDMLLARGLRATAAKFNRILENRCKENRPRALVLGRSETVLTVYERLLYQKGYAPQRFVSCPDAFKSAVQDPPGLIVSDLFLNEITFIEFALQIRKHHPPKELDFVISTLQQAFMGNKLAAACTGIGVREILAFPPAPGHIPSPR